MAFAHFLAMTSAEFDKAAPLPEQSAWMACHFSPYATGLSNMPIHLPEGSLLILNDRTPIGGHDPERIRGQLENIVISQKCAGLLLDFQRPGYEETAKLSECICRDFPCPVAVAPGYLQEGAAVFLPPVPATKSPEDYLAPWKGKTVWLESAMNGAEITLTPSGAQVLPANIAAPLPFVDEHLICHYHIEKVNADTIRFVLRRTPEDLQKLLLKVSALGVPVAVGLYQELGTTGIF